MRECSEDIKQNPNDFTAEQKADHEQGRLNDKVAIEWREFTNPRTGEVVRVPSDITPTFAHSHGDRLGALEALFADRHGEAALAEMVAQREAYLDKKLKPVGKEVFTLPLKVAQSRVTALMAKGSNNVKMHEAEAAAQLEKAMGVRLEVYDLANDKKPADYLIVDKDKPREQWRTVDFMFTEDEENTKSIAKLNQYFAYPEGQWERKKDNIQEHLQKADIVPLDLRHLNALNRAKLLGYVLSLPKEQQNRILLLVNESK